MLRKMKRCRGESRIHKKNEFKKKKKNDDEQSSQPSLGKKHPRPLHFHNECVNHYSTVSSARNIRSSEFDSIIVPTDENSMESMWDN